MRSSLRPLLKATTVALCAIGLLSATTPSDKKEEVAEEEYAIYSAVINHHFVPGHYGVEVGKLLLIKNRTNAGMPPGIILNEFPRLADQRKWFGDENVIRAFVSKSKNPVPLRPAFKLGLKYKLISSTAYRRFLDESANPKPGVFGVLSLGRIRFSHDRTVALLSYDYYCGNMCAESGYAILAQEKGAWSVIKILPQVISRFLLQPVFPQPFH